MATKLPASLIPLLLVGAAAADTGMRVDSGVRWIQECATERIAFRNATDGYLINACGGVYRSHDRGRSWTKTAWNDSPRSLLPSSGHSGWVHFFIWFSDQIGVIGGMKGFVVRTTDGGKTWEKRPVPSEEETWREDHLGNRIWLCDTTGNLLRSEDAAATWRNLGPLPTRDGCNSLSFANRDQGWVTGHHPGELWETHDAGATWNKLPFPDPQLSQQWATRINDKVGFLTGDIELTNRAYRTDDGGRTWTNTPVSTVEDRRLFASAVDFGAGVRALSAAKPIHSIADLQGTSPLPNWRDLAVLDDHESMIIADAGALHVFRDGALDHVIPGVLSAPTGKIETLTGVIKIRDSDHRAWASERIYRSEDGGRTWFVMSEAPEPITQLAMPNEGAALARGVSGKLYRSDDWFHSWRVTRNPADRLDWSRIKGGTPNVSSLTCLRTAKRGSLRLVAGERGCFSSSRIDIDITWVGDHGAISGNATKARGADSRARRISAVAANAYVARILDAMERGETGPACDSTSSHHATVEWSCDSATEERAEFAAGLCLDIEEGSKVDPGYKRATGLLDVARSLAKTNLR